MPGKYESIVALAAAAAQKITRGGEAYMAFLTTAAHNFKYNFRDQLLIYAQKPEATACAEIDFWNRHGRYVNKGTHGIALLVDTDAPYKLRHVFDMSDTNSRAGRVVPVWQMQPQYEAAVIEALENHFGEVTDRADFHACLLDTAKNIVEDNFSDYYADLLTVKEGSLLEELDEDSTEVWFRGLLQNSVAFMLLTRCGEDPTAYFEALDFSRIYDFNTPETISILGAAASDISEMALREVAVTVRSLMREEYLQNRTFAENSKRPYDRARETNSERSAAHGSDLQSRGRLSAAQPDRTGGPEGREIWDAASQLPQEPPQRHLHRDDALRESGRASGGDRPAGPRDGGAPDRTDGGAAGRERAVESNRSDEVGGSDEQHQSLGGGNRPAGADLQLTPTAPDIDWQAVGPAGLTLSHRAELPSSDIAYYHEDGEKNELIRTSDALKNHRTEIAAFFAAHENGQERGDFLKAFFDNILVEKILSNGQRAGYRAYDDGLLLWRGAFLTREQEVFLPWPQAADTIHGMMLLDHWLAPDERPLPTVNEQLSLIEQAESEKGSAFVLPQAAIDHVLCGGPAYSARRLRIYAQYQKQQGAQANTRFLKDEYGIGSHSNAIPGSSMWVKYDGKGMTFTLGDLTAPEATVTLTWKQVEKRVGELIAADRYLTPADKEQYQVKLAQDALQAARGEIADEFRSIVIAYKDYAEQHGKPDKTVDRWYLVNCADAFHYGRPKMYARTAAGDDILPMMREAMRTIIGENTPLTGRCEAILAALDGELAKPLEPEIAPPMEYRLSLGDTVYLGAQAFEIISLDGQTVRLYDPTFPLMNQELPRKVFEQRLAENPHNDHLLQSVEHTGEAPAAPLPAQQPVGRIDFLGTDGNVGDSVEYDDAEQFVAAIKEENHDGVPMRIVLYRDGGGRTISQDFLSELDPPPQGFQVMDAAEAQLDEARRRINAYCNEVFGQEADFSDLSHVDLAYSSTGDGAHSVGIFADLIHFRMVYQVDGATVVDIPCDTLRELNEYLANLDFDEMVAYAEEQYWQGEHAEPERTEQGQPEDSPFVRQVMQDVERVAAEDTTEPYERFHVIELDRGSKIAYGIWDDLHDGIYVDEDGVQEEFDGEWAANAYLERLKKAEAEKTAEDWLAVERAKLPPLEYAAGDHFSIFAADGNSKREVVLTSITDEDVFYLSTTQPEQEPVWMDKGEFERGLRSGHIREVQPSPAERETLQPVARYRSDGETILVYQYPNARYYIHYCYNDQQNTAYATAGGFDTFAQAEAALFSHRPAAERVTESAKEPQADAQGVEQPEQKAPLPPPPSRPRVRTSPFVLHPEIPEGQRQGAFTEYVLDDPEADEDRSIPADPNVRNFSFAVVDGEVYYRENSVMNPVEVSVTAANRIKGLIEIRDCVRTLIEYQTEDFPEEDIAAEQRKLNALYDAFVKKYGRINDRGNKMAFDTDSAYFLLASLEVLDDEGGFVRKADMFSKRTIKQRTVVTSVDTASEALALSLAERACVDLSYMASLMGGSEKIPQIVEDLAGVIFKDPQSGPFDFAEGGAAWVNGWQTADEYLSGNVREKLAQARQAAAANPRDFTSNVEALEAVQPKDLSASEISVRLGATWLPPELVEQFMFELFDTPNYCKWNIHVRFSQYTGEWNIEGKSYDRGNVKATKTYGTADVTGYKIIEETLNLRDVRIFDYHDDEKGRRVPVLDKKATAIAQGKQEQIKQAFQDWIWKDPQRRERLCRLYNDKFNAVRPREYDGSRLNFVGINPEITLRPHQVNAIAHILYGGNTLLAHVVGAGKTFEMVAAAQESKRLGLCQKSLFVVPNHLTEQWAAEYLQLYPSANILVATKKDFETRNRKRFCGRIATGDYDAIIIGHSQFEKIPMSVERQRFMLERQMREILDGLAELKANHGERFSVKQLERARKGVQAKLDKLNDQSRKDDVVTFEELGVDRLFVDEAHYYKNLAAFSKMRNVGGISQTEAQKSSDLYMKCRYLDELTDGHGVVFATGTPISNTMVEMYTMQKYLQYHTLKKNGLLHFDAWASTFGETVTAMELAPEGTGYRSKTRFAKFYNLPELMAMFKEVADIQTADMLNLPIPKAVYRHIVLKPSEHQKEMVADLSQRAERVRNHMVESSEDNMLLITNDGRKLALDQRMLSPMLPDSATSKVRACAENVFSIWRQTAEKRSTQLVFCDLSTPKSDGTFSVYNDLREKLIAMGIPEDEIAFIHSANTETKKKELFGKVCSGQIRVLLGSTQKMGAGTNVQQKLIALHHLDCPWRPADLQQREGRIVRQGNENDEVDIYTYVTENTFDSYLYQLVESKQKFIGQIMTSKSPVRSAEDIDETALSYAEIKALCTGNPHIKEKMDLDVAVQRLNLLKSNHLSQKYELEDQINKYFPREIAEYEQTIARYQADMAYLAANTHPDADGFSPMEIEGTVYTEKKAAGSAILAACKAMTSPDPVPLGQYRGFAMSLSFNSLSREFHISLKNRLHYDVALGMDLFGNIQRIDNALDGMGNHLRDCEVRLENVKVQLANAKVEVEKPFPQEEELREKTARLNELNVMLSMDKPENEIVDDGRGVDTAEPVRSSGDRAR